MSPLEEAAVAAKNRVGWAPLAEGSHELGLAALDLATVVVVLARKVEALESRLAAEAGQ